MRLSAGKGAVTAEPPASDGVLLAEQVRMVALEVLPRASFIADLITQELLAKLPQMAPQHTPDQIDVLRVAVEQNVGGILAGLAFGIEADLLEPLVGVVALLRQTTEAGGDITT